MSALGKLAYQTVFKPWGVLKNLGRPEGYPQKWVDIRNSRDMARELDGLSPFAQPQSPVFQACYLTGKDFIATTAWAHASLAHYSKNRVQPLFLSDGTLAKTEQERLVSLFPGAIVVKEEETSERINRLLPTGRYPRIRQVRDEVPITRKLFDLHSGRTGWRLYLDSDTCFFKNPILLEERALAMKPVHMQDVESVYGHEPAFLSSRLGKTVKERVNAGLVGMDSGKIDFEKIEHWLGQLLQRRRADWFVEQCLTAMLMTELEGEALPPSEYLILPGSREAKHPSAVFHHYAGRSRGFLYSTSWKHTRRALSSGQKP